MALLFVLHRGGRPLSECGATIARLPGLTGRGQACSGAYGSLSRFLVPLIGSIERNSYRSTPLALGSTPTAAMPRQDRLMPRDLDRWNPLRCLVCVVDEPAAAKRAVATLHAAWFADADVCLALAGSFISLDEVRRARTPLARLVATACAIGEEALATAMYLAEARAGHHTVIAYAPGAERMRHAQAIMSRHRGHTIYYYGHWTIRGLTDAQA